MPALAVQGEPLVAPKPVTYAASLSDADRARLDQAPLSELAFVPADVEAIVRVDLRALVARAVKSDNGKESLKTLDFVLRAQQPAAWEVLHGAGITVGRDITGLYLVVGPNAKEQDSYLVAAVGTFDAGKLAEGLRRKVAPALASGQLTPNVTIEPAPARTGETATLFVWHDAGAGAAGATEQPTEAKLGDAAVGLVDGLVLIGTPDLCRRALATRAGSANDVRWSPLIHDVLAADTDATAWGAAASSGPSSDGALISTLVPGVVRGRFAASLAAPGAADGLFRLEAEFTSTGDAEIFRAKLLQLMSVAATLSDRSPLGATFKRLHDSANISVDGKKLSATAAL